MTLLVDSGTELYPAGVPSVINFRFRNGIRPRSAHTMVKLGSERKSDSEPSNFIMGISGQKQVTGNGPATKGFVFVGRRRSRNWWAEEPFQSFKDERESGKC